jgi:putative glutamine amidotransferase
MEIFLFNEAVINMDKPVLGICRGIQLINVPLGGTLYQDLSRQYISDISIIHRQEPPYSVTCHKVNIIADGMTQIFPDLKTIEVNSIHHQGIRVLAPDLECLAVAEDGLIEAVCLLANKYVYAVQWHPERLLHLETSRILFASFVNACGS